MPDQQQPVMFLDEGHALNGALPWRQQTVAEVEVQLHESARLADDRSRVLDDLEG